MRRRALFLAVLPAALSGCSALPASKPTATPRPVTAQVFFDSEATQDQEAAVRHAIQSGHGVTAVEYETREQAYRRFKETFKDDPHLVATARLEDFTDDIRFRARTAASARALLARVRKMGGVRKVQILPTASPSASPR
ncbi:permease-like cell division protein FtsX [Actinocatenispora rupis]|uniref:FtsX extracellular domain-containing protein n=1 Tax=Actinocatenispora rupis TaxID=519421 RepID=A0A8J3J5N0_9ACTN|nr:permease-like cell division protein FtsX [Actinocatenispora rupis]GID12407.1 hypothetical protein Aru02nite_32960 [Actinocatenispora rupis]